MRVNFATAELQPPPYPSQCTETFLQSDRDLQVQTKTVTTVFTHITENFTTIIIWPVTYDIICGIVIYIHSSINHLFKKNEQTYKKRSNSTDNKNISVKRSSEITANKPIASYFAFLYRLLYRCSASHSSYQNTIRSGRKNFTLLNRNSSPRGSVRVQE